MTKSTDLTAFYNSSQNFDVDMTGALYHDHDEFTDVMTSIIFTQKSPPPAGPGVTTPLAKGKAKAAEAANQEVVAEHGETRTTVQRWQEQKGKEKGPREAVSSAADSTSRKTAQ